MSNTDPWATPRSGEQSSTCQHESFVEGCESCDRRRQAATPSYPNVQYGPQPPYPTPRRTNGLAIASLILGIVWIYWIGSVLAIIFGHVALGQVKRDQSQDGKGMAIAGLVLGYIGAFFLVLVIVVSATASSGSGS